MVIEIFNGEIGVPAKCGTRFFSKTQKNPDRMEGYWSREVTSLVTSLPTNIINTEFQTAEKLNWEVWRCLKYFVIRNPMEHLMSALHTDMVTCLWDISEIKIVLDKYLSEYGDTLYHPNLYCLLYILFKELKINPKCMDISEVSLFISNSGFDIQYDKDEYSFKDTINWKSKEEGIELVKTNFPIEWDKLVRHTIKDTEYYNYLLSNTRKIL